MRSSWPLAEDLQIEQVGQPGEGMPVTGVERGKRPLNRYTRQSLSKVRIVRIVIGVVVIDKIGMNHRPKCKDGYSGQNKAGDERISNEPGKPRFVLILGTGLVRTHVCVF